MSSSPTETARRRDDAPDGRLGRRGHGRRLARRAGDPIEAEETICEISTDKIDTEVPAPASGVVTEILVAIGETVEVGIVLARIATGAGGASPAQPLKAAPAALRP